MERSEIRRMLHSDSVIKKYSILYDGLQTRINQGNEHVINLDRFVVMLVKAIEFHMDADATKLHPRTVMRLALNIAANMVFERTTELVELMRNENFKTE